MTSSRRFLTIGVALIALLIGCAGGAALRQVVVPARAEGALGTNYQYDSVNLQQVFGLHFGPEEVNQVLNQYGQQGWRMVAFEGAFVVFERPVSSRVASTPRATPEPTVPPASQTSSDTPNPFTEDE